MKGETQPSGSSAELVPLDRIEITCSVCGELTTALEVHEDKARFHTRAGSRIRLPSAGLNPEEIEKLRTTFLRCECCQEDHEEKFGPSGGPG